MVKRFTSVCDVESEKVGIFFSTPKYANIRMYMKCNNGEICRKVRGTLMFHKRKSEVSCVTAGGLLLLLIAIKSQMLVTEDYTGRTISVYQAAPLCAYVLLAGLICTVIMWSGKIKYQKASEILAVLTLCIMPVISFLCLRWLLVIFLQSCIIRLGWYC